MTEQIFFQSSFPRAGSTLLQNIFFQNPDFFSSATSGVLELLFAARKNYSESPEFKAQDETAMENAWRSFCYHGLTGYYKGLTDKKYVLDKSRGWGYYYGFLNFFYPEPKIICMIRDPRDVISSMEKKFRATPEKDIGIVNNSSLIGTTTEKRVDIWCNGQPAGMAFERLYQIIKEGNDKKILFIKYENLCHNPNKEMQRAYEYLGIDFYQHDFDNIEQKTVEDDKNVYGIFGDHSIRPQLKALKSDSREILGKPVCDWIFSRYEWFYDKFGYNH